MILSWTTVILVFFTLFENYFFLLVLWPKVKLEWQKKYVLYMKIFLMYNFCSSVTLTSHWLFHYPLLSNKNLALGYASFLKQKGKN